MSNRFTKYTADKLRTDGWLDKDQSDQLRTQLKSVEADAAVMRGALVKAAVLLEKNNGQHGESASWNGKEGTNRAAWMIQENDALIDEIAAITKGSNDHH